jgi:hypothetical protein
LLVHQLHVVLLHHVFVLLLHVVLLHHVFVLLLHVVLLHHVFVLLLRRIMIVSGDKDLSLSYWNIDSTPILEGPLSSVFIFMTF